MKKTIVVALTAGLVAGALVGPADAGKKKKPPVPPTPVKVERVVELTYGGPSLGVTTPAASGGYCFSDPTAACMEVPLQAGEKYIKVSVADTSGQKSYGFLDQGDVDGDTIGDLYGDFCGEHPEPIELLSESVPVTISLYNGAQATCAPSIVTNGTVTVTLSNML